MRLKNTQTELAIITNQTITLFDSFGRFKQGDLVLDPRYLSGCIPVRAISVLNSNGFTEIATVDENDIIKIYIPKENKSETIVTTLNSMGNFHRMCMKTGEFENTKYTQMLFLYDIDKNIDAIVKLLCR